MLGNEDAVQFLSNIFYIIHVWDDLIDKDKEVYPESINKSFWYALIEIPRNPFFIKYSNFLTTQFQLFVNQWLDSNKLSTDGVTDESLNYSFVLKDTSIDLIAQCAFVLGGYDHMRKVSIELRELLLTHHTLAEYKNEILNGDNNG